MTVIADDEAPSSSAASWGRALGYDETVNVFLEVALFDPVRTAATGQAWHPVGCLLPLRARRRPGLVVQGAEIATRMILDLCGGTASS